MNADRADAVSPDDQPPPTRSTRGRRRWLAAVAGLWALSLIAAGAVSAHTQRPTVREQHNLAQADRVVDQAMGELAAAAAPHPILELSADAVTPGCRLTPVRDGAVLRRSLTVATGGPSTAEVLEKIRRRLPPGFRPTVVAGRGGDVAELRADAGGFVTVRGTATGPDEVTLTADTGCRPPARLTPAPIPERHDRQGLAPLLTVLGIPSARLSLAWASCPNGGAVRAVWADGAASAEPGSLATVLPALAAGAIVLVNEPDHYAYRHGSVTVSARRTGDTIKLTSTTSCTGA